MAKSSNDSGSTQNAAKLAREAYAALSPEDKAKHDERKLQKKIAAAVRSGASAAKTGIDRAKSDSKAGINIPADVSAAIGVLVSYSLANRG